MYICYFNIFNLKSLLSISIHRSYFVKVLDGSQQELAQELKFARKVLVGGEVALQQLLLRNIRNTDDQQIAAGQSDILRLVPDLSGNVVHHCALSQSLYKVVDYRLCYIGVVVV